MDKHIEKVAIQTEYIQLDQLVKFSGLLSTGGQIKPLLEEKCIFVNGEICTAKRKKLYHGDVVDIKGLGSLLVVKGEEGSEN